MKRILSKSVITGIIICALSAAAGAALFAALTAAHAKSEYSLGADADFNITNLDEVVGLVRDALVSRSAKISITLTLNEDYMDSMSRVIKEIMDLACLPTGKAKEGDYIRYQLGGYTFTYGYEKAGGKYSYFADIVPEYYTTLAQEEETDSMVLEILSLPEFKQAKSDFEKISVVAEYLKENVSYDLVRKSNDNYHLKSTAYAALVMGSASCQGYSVAMSRLLLEMGTDSKIIIGTGITEDGEEIHSWNIVRIGDVWYNTDPTWYATRPDKDYFLKSDDDFEDHVRDEEYSTEEFYLKYPMAAVSFSPD